MKIISKDKKEMTILNKMISFQKKTQMLKNKVLRMQKRYVINYVYHLVFQLPIVAHKKEILQKLEQNTVVIISGDTGCGKTTQVPKFILENASEKNVDFNIICTQPRRIAAQNIAKR